MEAEVVVSGPLRSKHERGWVSNLLIQFQPGYEEYAIRSQLKHTFRGSDRSSNFNISECHENFRKILGGLEADGLQ